MEGFGTILLTSEGKIKVDFCGFTELATQKPSLGIVLQLRCLFSRNL